MRALLLAAGFGTRLRPITNSIPKCLVEIDKKPLLGYWFDLLGSTSIEKIIVNTHYLSEKVNEFIKTSSCHSKLKVVHEENLLGTGGTILKNKDFFKDGSFLVAHADNLTLFDLEEFITVHNARPEFVQITMMTFDTDAPNTCGIVEIDKNGIVIQFHEKVSNPPGNKANAAVYICEPSIIRFLETLDKETIDLSTEVLPHFMGKIQIYHNSKYHRDIGTIESLNLANEEFKKLRN